MRANQEIQATPQFRVLSRSQMEEIHRRSLHILQRTGVAVYHEEALRLLEEAGAYLVGDDRVLIPPALAEEALSWAPSGVTVYSRDGEPAMYLEDSRSYYGTGADCLYVIDPYTGERRTFTGADLVAGMKVCDALPNIDFVMSMGIISDAPRETYDINQFEIMVGNTSKPVVFQAQTPETCETIIEMAAAVVGGRDALRMRPFIILYAEPSSPLRHSREALGKLLAMAEAGLPTVYAPGIMVGATSPVTSAAALVQANAEILSGLLIAQLKRKGSPFIYGAGTPPIDMATMVCSYSAPEHMLRLAAMADMARFYDLPSWGFAGCSDSKILDQQAAAESGMWALISAVTGANLVHDVGYLGSGLTMSFEMVVLNDEIIGAVKSFMAGIRMDDEAFAEDVIHNVGPGGHFLGDEHTLRHFRENWMPRLFDRSNYTSWEAAGRPDLHCKANARVREILASHSSRPLPEEKREALRRIVEREDGRR